jgi:hypothetical protein
MVDFLCALGLFVKIPQTEDEIKGINSKQIVNIEINFELLKQQYAECNKCLEEIQMHSNQWDAVPKKYVTHKLLQDTRKGMVNNMFNEINKHQHDNLCPHKNSSICDHCKTYDSIPCIRLYNVPLPLIDHLQPTYFEVYARTQIVSRLKTHKDHFQREENGYTHQQNYNFAISKMCVIGKIWQRPNCTMKCTKLNIQSDNQRCGLEILCRDLGAVKTVESNIKFSNTQQTNPVDDLVCLVPSEFIINQI